MNDFKSRLLDEKSQLSEKLQKLKAFQESSNFASIDPVQQALLNVQAASMATYEQCLTERLKQLAD